MHRVTYDVVARLDVRSTTPTCRLHGLPIMAVKHCTCSSSSIVEQQHCSLSHTHTAQDRRAVLGAPAAPPAPAPPPAGATLPELVSRLDVGALSPAVPPASAHAALLSLSAGPLAAEGPPSGLVAATQGVMRSNVMAAVEVLKVFWRAACADGAVPHLPPDKAARYRTALAKQHRAYV